MLPDPLKCFGEVKARLPSHIRAMIARMTFDGFGHEYILAKLIRAGHVSRNDRAQVEAECKRYWK